MTSFVRQNQITCTATFSPADGIATQPTNAEMRLVYTNLSGAKQTDDVTLTNTAGIWSGIWDSTNCKGGAVEWVVRCWGNFAAAKQGSFFVEANEANT